MSQKGDSENDIWDYKPLGKKKKRGESPSASATVLKKRCLSGKRSQKSKSAKSIDDKVETTKHEDCAAGDDVTGGEGSSNGSRGMKNDCYPFRSSVLEDTDQCRSASSEDFCPMCQLPFSILVVQTQRWHVAECLETSRDSCEECPDGFQCGSTNPSHYKKFNHTVLAHSRANGSVALLSLCQPTGPCLKTTNTEVESSILQTSQDSLASSSQCSASPLNGCSQTPPSKVTNGLQFLRSPGPEDFKKKKGWLSSTKGRKSVSSSQESSSRLSSTPVKAEIAAQTPESPLKCEASADYDELISYSPLSEFPKESEVRNYDCPQSLFNGDMSESEAEGSVELFSDDELFSEFIDHMEADHVPAEDAQLESVKTAPPTNQEAACSVAQQKASCTELDGRPSHSGSSGVNSVQSPQSLVLERLRETLRSSDTLPLKSLNNSSVQSPHTSPPPVPATMPLECKTTQASCLKQMDIGVFFGLKPLKQEEQKVAKGGAYEQDDSSAPAFGDSWRRPRQPRKDRQRTKKAETSTAASQEVGEESRPTFTRRGGGGGGGGRGGGGGGGRGGWRGRWNRVNSDGEVELPRCPFYKKIPGTKFVIDAFGYGEVEGITAYFLTHFHSDHYGGLTKNSTFPIYCNKITGNLVKSKLKVAEQYVHMLPMNTPVTVEGVKVILLDANHCPGAAMLLFFLPDGQTVLHTGDFRADPSMETYPELLGCRVQTLYLDTTYCSPEYTFPRQQEVITFAANTVFELVTLKPRTLVVCGSYSVGKEKVFLALAEVLGSKVCLSRDKFNTMCCLESEQVRKLITTDWKAARVHVLPMMQLTFKKLQDHLARFSGQYDQLVAFKPTGWTFSQQVESVEDIQPHISGNISIYGIPYSEHSSFLELKRFVQWLQPRKIIPTVNVGSWDSRKAMEKCFSEWLAAAKAKQ